MTRVEKDLVFATTDGSELTLDIYRAPNHDAPVTIYVHGGGWRSGDKSEDRHACHSLDATQAHRRIFVPGAVARDRRKAVASAA